MTLPFMETWEAYALPLSTFWNISVPHKSCVLLVIGSLQWLALNNSYCVFPQKRKYGTMSYLCILYLLMMWRVTICLFARTFQFLYSVMFIYSFRV
jgi:hypothetical protein